MYINTETNQYPVSESEIRFANPNTSFAYPFVAPEQYAWVFPSPPPTFDPIVQCVREVAPVLTDKGNWEQQWEVVPRFTEYTDEQGVAHTVAEQEATAVAADQAAKAKALEESIVQQTQQRLDDFARTRNYDNILSACTYASSTVPKFKTEGQYCVDARDNTWATLYQIISEVKAGTRPMPTGYLDIEFDLPTLVWPN